MTLFNVIFLTYFRVTSIEDGKGTEIWKDLQRTRNESHIESKITQSTS
jgi:hypothetical protein